MFKTDQKKFKTFIALIPLLILFSFEEKKEIYLWENPYRTKYQVESKDGMFNGDYISWYKNGKIKAKGKLKNNNRIGEWIVYDTTGRKIVVRDYINLFQYKNVFPESDNSRPTCDLSKNEKGFIDYPKLLEKNVILEDRIWRTIEPNKTNVTLFSKSKLFDVILRNVIADKLLAFDPSSEEFLKQLSSIDLNKQLNREPYKVVGFKIKEDWYYDSNMKLSSTQIIGICPIIKNKTNETQIDLFWIYYPSLREILANEKITVKNEPSITTLEDLFHFRYFSSWIYKKLNPYNRKISDYEKGDGIKKEAEQIEMDILDNEHSIWLEGH